jgi:hypothetical protein
MCLYFQGWACFVRILTECRSTPYISGHHNAIPGNWMPNFSNLRFDCVVERHGTIGWEPCVGLHRGCLKCSQCNCIPCHNTAGAKFLAQINANMQEQLKESVALQEDLGCCLLWLPTFANRGERSRSERSSTNHKARCSNFTAAPR